MHRPNPRTQIIDLANAVNEMLRLQQAYFKARKAKLTDCRRELEASRTQERYIANLVAVIKQDHAELRQASLFDAPAKVQEPGITQVNSLLPYYGKAIEAEIYRENADTWVPCRMDVNAIAMRYAELGRMRNMQPHVEEKEVQDV